MLNEVCGSVRNSGIDLFLGELFEASAIILGTCTLRYNGEREMGKGGYYPGMVNLPGTDSGRGGGGEVSVYMPPPI